MKTHPWHAINAGGSPRIAFVLGTYIVPMFSSHEACSGWWRRYAEKGKEQPAWAVTDHPNTWPDEKVSP